MGRIAAPRGRQFGTVVACAVAVLLAVPTAADSVAFDRLLSRPDTRTQGGRWIERNFPSGATVFQTGIFYGHLQPTPLARYPQVVYNARHGVFFSPGGAQLFPDVVVLPDSPLRVYSGTPPGLEQVLRERYVLAQVFHARRTGAAGLEGIYDEQDAWYLPLARLSSVERAGPDVSIYVRRDAATAAHGGDDRRPGAAAFASQR